MRKNNFLKFKHEQAKDEAKKIKDKKYQRAKRLANSERYKGTKKLFNNECFITGRRDLKHLVFHHIWPKMKKFELGKGQFQTDEDFKKEANKCVLLSFPKHQAVHCILSSLRGKTDATYELVVTGLRDLYRKLEKTCKK